MVLIVCALLAACSSAGPLDISDTTSFRQSQQESRSGVILETATEDTAALAATDEDVDASQFPVASFVPTRAPRDPNFAASTTSAGTDLAFAAESETQSGQPIVLGVETDAAQVSAAQEEQIAVSEQQVTAQIEAVREEKPKSLFAFFAQRQKQKQVDVARSIRPVQTASLKQDGDQRTTTLAMGVSSNSIDATRAALSSEPRAGSGNLRGVRSGNTLFGATADEIDEEESEQIQVASVGGFGRLSPNGLRLQTDKVDVHCFQPELLALLKQIERHYKRQPIITSGYRSPKANRRAGGARRSMHIDCKAADIQIEGVAKWKLAKFLHTLPGRGGVGTYCRTESVHIDTGEERDWHYPCRRQKSRAKKA